MALASSSVAGSPSVRFSEVTRTLALSESYPADSTTLVPAAAVRATGEVLVGLDAQNEASLAGGDGADVNALDTELRIRARAPAAMRPSLHRSF